MSFIIQWPPKKRYSEILLDRYNKSMELASELAVLFDDGRTPELIYDAASQLAQKTTEPNSIETIRILMKWKNKALIGEKE